MARGNVLYSHKQFLNNQTDAAELPAILSLHVMIKMRRNVEPHAERRPHS